MSIVVDKKSKPMAVEELEEIEAEYQDLFDAFDNEDESLIK
jgi:hypothetical protein